MSNSKLITYTNLSSNCNKGRNHVIDTITIHAAIAPWTARRGCDYFANETKGASCNYFVGHDGSIGLSVNECDRSWCSSSSSNDNRAVTIEVASDTYKPYAVTDKAYNALVELVTDICKRNDIKKLLWKNDKSLIGQVDKQNMTVHCWFANKDCPGEYLLSRHGAIADAVNKKLGVTPVAIPTISSNATTNYLVRVTADTLNIRAGAGINYNVVGKIIDRGTYTIVQESNGQGASRWGKLKSGAGWIALDYCQRV